MHKPFSLCTSDNQVILPILFSGPDIMMIDVDRDFGVEVWTYTYATGPQAGQVFFHSPQSSWSHESQSIVLRQVNSRDANNAWICGDSSLVTRLGGDDELPITIDVQGLIVKGGFGTALYPTCGNPNGDGAPLVPYGRGERVWVETSFNQHQNEHGLVPVISLDTLEAYTMPSEDICWVPQLVGTCRNGNQAFSVLVGPNRPSTGATGIHYTQTFFQWPVGQPQMAECHWDKWKVGDDTSGRKLARFQPIDNVNVRRDIFRQHWVLHLAKLGVTQISNPPPPSPPSTNSQPEPAGDDHQDPNAISYTNENPCCRAWSHLHRTMVTVRLHPPLYPLQGGRLILPPLPFYLAPKANLQYTGQNILQLGIWL